MEAALVTVSMGVMNPLLSKLSKLLEQEHAKIKGVRRDVKFIGNEMRSMKAALETLADEEQLDAEMRIWKDDVRELSYDMEDCVDDFVARVDNDPDESTGLKKFFCYLKKLKPCHEISNEIGKLRARATEASERHKRYNIVRPTPDSSTCGVDPRLHALYEDVDKLVGIDGPKSHIIEWLKREGSSPQLKVVSIVGPGGLGKTTLAKEVYHAMKRNFPCGAFVSVSQKPDMKNVLRDIARRMGVTTTRSTDDERQIIDIIRDHLEEERYFVVIDDVWDQNAWQTIRHALLDNNNGSRIITTSRNTAVASYCSSKGNYVYEMKPLSLADSRRLLFRRAFDSEPAYHPHLEKVSNKILKKCGGLPLAIITISSLLTDQHAQDEWNRILGAIGSALAKDPDAENMTKILSLSYFDLPHRLKTCLLYLSVFPEDYRIKKQCLINRWIAEGFIHEERGRSTYEVGEGYFNDLINRSLIQLVDIKYGQVETCRVHDIVLDFISCKAAEENFVTSFNVAEHIQVSDYKVRRVCVLNPCNELFTIPAGLLSHARSLTIFGKFGQSSLLSSAALRVLDLGECDELEDHHLANIENLFLLKYLCLGHFKITELPRNIGKLQFLETLDIRRTQIEELPSTMTGLQQLARLYIHKRTRFPDGVIGHMKSLQELQKFGIFSSKQAKSLQELCQLTKLRTLAVAWSVDRSKDCSGGGIQVENLEQYLGNLISSSSLHHLYIHRANKNDSDVCLSKESWRPNTCSFRKLHIAHTYIDKVPNWMSTLANLMELELYIYSMRQEDVQILGTIPTLLFLKLNICRGTNGMIFIHGFRSLKYFDLIISHGKTSVEFEEGSMPKLEHLKLDFPVHNMGCLKHPSDFGIQHLSALTKVDVNMRGEINWCDELTADKFACLIRTAVGTLPKCPTLSFEQGCDLIVHQNFAEWDRVDWYLQIEQDREQVVAGVVDQKACSVSHLRVLDETNEENEEAQQEDGKAPGSQGVAMTCGCSWADCQQVDGRCREHSILARVLGRERMLRAKVDTAIKPRWRPVNQRSYKTLLSKRKKID